MGFIQNKGSGKGRNLVLQKGYQHKKPNKKGRRERQINCDCFALPMARQSEPREAPPQMPCWYTGVTPREGGERPANTHPSVPGAHKGCFTFQQEIFNASWRGWRARTRQGMAKGDI